MKADTDKLKRKETSLFVKNKLRRLTKRDKELANLEIMAIEMLDTIRSLQK